MALDLIRPSTRVSFGYCFQEQCFYLDYYVLVLVHDITSLVGPFKINSPYLVINK